MRVGFIGDIALLGAYSDPEKVTVRQNVKLLLSSCDYLIANLECSVVEQSLHSRKNGHVIGVADFSLDLLNKIGITHVSLANNHSLDYGLIGLELTKESLSKRGIEYFGLAEKPTVKISSGLKQLHITSFVTPDTNPDTSVLNTDVDVEIKSLSVDYRVLYAHWGGTVEDGHVPNKQQTMLARQSTSSSYDVVIGSHTHTIQDTVGSKRKHVYYGIGNFCFSTLESGKVLSARMLERRRIGRIVICDFEGEGVRTTSKDIFFDINGNIREINIIQKGYLLFMKIISSFVNFCSLFNAYEKWLHFYYPIYSYFINNEGGVFTAVKELKIDRIKRYLMKWKK